MAQLLDDIEAFLAAHPGLSPTALGDGAMGDRHLVRQLRAGRRVWPETEAKVRAFMSQFGQPSVTACSLRAAPSGRAAEQPA